MLAEIGGKAAGYCAGKGGSMHIADMGLGHLGANAIVGGGIPHVVGAALADRRRGDARVSVAFFGDGAMQQGVLYESMNLAALWKLPVVFCCVNNQYGMGTRVDRAAASVAFDERARAFGLEAAVPRRRRRDRTSPPVVAWTRRSRTRPPRPSPRRSPDRARRSPRRRRARARAAVRGRGRSCRAACRSPPLRRHGRDSCPCARGRESESSRR